MSTLFLHIYTFSATPIFLASKREEKSHSCPFISKKCIETSDKAAIPPQVRGATGPHKKKGELHMASNQTSFYQLNQWEPEDKVLREEFNADNSRVDGALHSLAEEVGARALQTEVDGLKTQLATKAAQSALDSLSASVTAGLAKKYGTDNPYIKAGSYMGDGAATRTISVGFQPSLVMIFSMDCNSIDSNYAFLLGDSTAQLTISVGSRNKITQDWLGLTSTGFTLQMPTISFTHFNSEGCSYRYLVFR